MRRRRSLERQTVRSVPIGRPCDERSLASCVQTVAWRSRISQRGRRKHPSQIALGAHRATFGHWLNLFHGGSRDHRSARCYRQSKCTSLRQPCAPTAIGEGGFCSGLFITHLLLLGNQIVHAHDLSSTWCIGVPLSAGNWQFSSTRVELNMNSTPMFARQLPSGLHSRRGGRTPLARPNPARRAPHSPPCAGRPRPRAARRIPGRWHPRRAASRAGPTP